MRFGEIFNKSWNEYSSTFNVFLKSSFILLGIPALVILIYNLFFALISSDVRSMLTNYNINGMLLFNFSSMLIIHWIGALILGVVALVFSLIFYSGAIWSTLNLKNLTFDKLYKNGKSNFWRYVLFIILVGIFIFLLLLALVIPAIVFMVFWSVALFVYYHERTGIIDSLGRSFNLVRGRWWKTFGYLVLIMIIMIAIGLVVFIPYFILSVLGLAGTFLTDSLIIYFISQVISILFTLVYAVIGIFFLFFLKNLYLELKESKKSPKKVLKSKKK